MPTPAEPAWRRHWPWLAAAVLAALAVAQSVEPDGDLGNATYLAGLVLASVLAVVGAARPGARRVPRRLLAAGVVCSTLGDLLWTLESWLRDATPSVSLPDVPWLSSYLLVGAAMVATVPEWRRRIRSDGDALIDMAVVAVLAILVVGELWAGPMIFDGSVPVLDRTVWATYPVLDALLLCLLVRMLLDGETPRRVTWPLAGGVSCWLVSDMGFLVVGEESWLVGPMNAGWIVGAALLATACWTMRTADDRDGPARDRTAPGRVSTVRLGIAYLGLIVPWAFVLVDVLGGHDDLAAPLVAALVVTALVWRRTLHLLHQEQEAVDSLEASERLFRKLALNSSDAVMVLDRDGVLRRESPGLAELVGIPDAGAVGDDVVGGSDDERATGGAARRLLDAALASAGEPVDEELRLTWDEEERWLAVRAVNLLDDPDVQGIVVTLSDITDRKRMEELLVRQATHDHLTGLANRTLFRDRLHTALSLSRDEDDQPAVLYVDLDGFKHVNDSLGHDAGDDLLREVARRMTTVLRPGDTVARLGGDEFAVLLDRCADAPGAAERVRAALADPIVLANGPISLSASIGIARGGDGSSPGSMLREADTAMYRAKAAGRGRWMEYEPAMRDAAVRRLQLENELHVALACDQLRLEYQPVVGVADRRVVGFEALLRWRHPDLGEVGPDEFVPLAEEIGVIDDIGRWVLRHACAQAAVWRKRYGSHLTMAVNVSGRQLESGRLDVDVHSALVGNGLAADALVLEITETALIGDDVAALAAVHRLRELGVGLAVDDFGTGYSSLSHLQQYPVHVLKIDRSFVAEVASGESGPDMVRGLVDLAKVLGLETVAEGVETPEQLDRLRELGCDMAQGYLIARPKPADLAATILQVPPHGRPAPAGRPVSGRVR
ncbi:putative bifunctional diguanylate cyclase/phosphodiesterase [Dermatobacter hominis]|uniref:putative bifunctional diguanylate cyclase/phosphodiesterase n=1 Tax=Dermatobacter hominis TaxID=2884263 RepID=UPI001D1099E3|nr:EAL domain-containing protein [Dermatobacter hominis]UDY36358.1 EAL domain-containing protein [Dermatobacter hominis]